mgnify:CR=1 FL=1
MLELLHAFERELEEARSMVDSYLEKLFQESVPEGSLHEAMRYSLLAGGKRLRPVLTLKFAEACGGRMEDALIPACAVELMHTYSLIHDDLPCMDNDTLRRGQPTSHVKFGEWLAVLAGDALQTAAFELLLSAPLPAETVVKMGAILAKAAGRQGMCLGQVMDMRAQGQWINLDELTYLHYCKTAALLMAAAQIGVLAAGGTEVQLNNAGRYAYHLGLAYQITDDILDATGTTQELGKTAGKDARSFKPTFITLMSMREARGTAQEQTNSAIASLRGTYQRADFLEKLAIYLMERRY